MRYIASLLTLLAGGLWLGGLIALFLFVPNVFNAFGETQRDTAGIATSAMFAIFARYQLAVAAAALLGAFLGYATGRRTVFVAIFTLFALATLGAVYNAVWLVPEIDKLRLEGQSASHAFKRLHGLSMILYVSKTALVLLAIALIPATRPHTPPPPTSTNP